MRYVTFLFLVFLVFAAPMSAEVPAGAISVGEPGILTRVGELLLGLVTIEAISSAVLIGGIVFPALASVGGLIVPGNQWSRGLWFSVSILMIMFAATVLLGTSIYAGIAAIVAALITLILAFNKNKTRLMVFSRTVLYALPVIYLLLELS